MSNQVRDLKGRLITVRTIKHGLELIEELKNAPVTHLTNKQAIENRRRLRRAKINEIERVINRIKDRLNKSQWIEAEFGDLPTGTIFTAYLSMNSDKAVPISTGHRVYPAKKKFTQSQKYKLMKSCGNVCFIISPGMDQGSMLELESDRVVTVRHKEKTLICDQRNKMRESKDRSEEMADEWEGI